MKEDLLKVEGMSCNHCKMTVENAVEGKGYQVV